MAAPQSRNLVLWAGALVVFAGLTVWLLVTPPGDEGARAVPAAAPEPPVETPAVAAVAQPEPTPEPAKAKAPEPKPATAETSEGLDFFAGPMPDFMARAHVRVLDGKWLDARMQKELYNFGQEHKDDARPQLLLAWDSMNRDWDGYAVRLYRMAFRADSKAKREPSMLRDLLDIAARHDRTEFRETVGIVKEAFGEEALPAIDTKLAELRDKNDLQGAARLQRLRDKVTGD